ncbi:MAG TPA: aspartate aminotransferase [Elusimicrobia bacterium]|nr:aspartate aminotransferase [Elusimicrobiota bacterium]HBT60889.1 aspartate aminotransferase [Elusimicrobiota bacterium]
MEFADWMPRLGTETAFDVLVRARALEAQGRKIIHLEIGEPDFDTPKNIREKAKDAIDKGWTHYGPAAGLPETRAALAEYLTKTRGVNYAPEETIIMPGGKPVVFFTIMALVNPGDEVIYPNPGFPIYESMINFIGAKAVPLPIREENDFNLDIAELERLITPKTKLLIINSPANPTGGFLEKDALEQIARILAKHPDVMVLSDEIYSRILYDKARHHSIAEFPGMKERTIILEGFSKTYAMTGWRLGYAAANKDLVTALARLSTNCHSCTASFAQIAAIEALKGPQGEVDKMVAEFQRRRDVIVEGLNKLPGFSCKTPKASFYVFPNIRKLGKPSKEVADFLLQEAGVACLSGTAFGACGEGYLRFSYANSVENIRQAIQQIADALPRLKKTAATR